MAFSLFLLPDAARDIEEIIEWYGKENKDLFFSFIETIAEALQTITINPFHFQEIYKNFHSINTRRFPYKIIYRIDDGHIVIVAIIHHKRNPKVWKKRTK